MFKGISLLSGIIFLAFTIAAVAIIYQTGMPIVAKMQAAASIEKMRSSFTDLDEIIREVASEGRGSKRSIYLRIDPGKIIVDGSRDIIYWMFETTAKVISPRTRQVFGNLVVGSNLETSAYETTYAGEDAFVLENEYMNVSIKKIGSPDNHTSYTTSEILLDIYNKDTGEYLPLEYLEISINDDQQSVSGTGYTMLVEEGENLPYATITAYMNFTLDDYYVNFTLESGADFLKIEASD